MIAAVIKIVAAIILLKKFGTCYKDASFLISLNIVIIVNPFMRSNAGQGFPLRRGFQHSQPRWRNISCGQVGFLTMFRSPKCLRYINSENSDVLARI